MNCDNILKAVDNRNKELIFLVLLDLSATFDAMDRVMLSLVETYIILSRSVLSILTSHLHAVLILHLAYEKYSVWSVQIRLWCATRTCTKAYYFLQINYSSCNMLCKHKT